MKKTVAVVNSENVEIISAIEKYFGKSEVEVCIVECEEDLSSYSLVALTSFENPDVKVENSQIINVFPALLPSFADKNPLRTSFLSGIKVGGITVHKVEKDNFYGKILAQYPVLIGNSTHFDDYSKEILSVAKFIYPKVIEAVLYDRVFDFYDLVHSKTCAGSCSGSCSSCCGH